MQKSFILSVLVLLFVAVVSCKKGETNTNSDPAKSDLSGTIEMDGSSTVGPISEAIAEEFEKENEVGVNIGISGTGGGFKKFTKGEMDICNASRPIKEEEAAEATKNGIEYVELEVAYDGLAVIVNQKNTWTKDLTVAELKKMWEPAAEGKVTKWNQIRSNFPDESIKLYGAGTDSGTYDYFTEEIVKPEKGAPKSRSDFNSSEDDNILVEGVAGDKGAIGFFGLAYYEENKDKLQLVSVNKVFPTFETVMNKTYSPLSRPLYIYVNSKAAKRPEVQAYVRFYLENAAKLVKEVGYIPLTDETYKAQLEKFNRFAK
jgi:phosphate transport system substrate-binding protein